MGDFRHVRYQAAEPDARGAFPGVFALFNGLVRSGRLTEEQETFRRVDNAWLHASCTDPSTVDPTVYDRINPGAVAWFTVSATQLVDRLSGCLAILDAHGVAWQKLESDDPGRIVHEDQDQVVVVPHGTRYVRFQAALPDRQGRFLGVFALVNMMARRDQLTPAQHLFRRLNNDWYDANFTNPAAVDPTVYASPGAAAWFRHTSPHLISRVAGYLAILDAHGVAWQRLDSDDPGRIVYEDQDQVVVVPHDECIKLD